MGKCTTGFTLRRRIQGEHADKKVAERESSQRSSSQGGQQEEESADQKSSTGNGLDLGPIALSFGGSTNESRGRLVLVVFCYFTPAMIVAGSAAYQGTEAKTAAFAGEESYAEASTSGLQSIHSMKTEEWQQQFEADGYVDLWVEEEFNAGSRLVVNHRRLILLSHAQ